MEQLGAGVEQVVERLRNEKQLVEEVALLRAEVEDLKKELAMTKTSDRFGALVTMMQWGKETAVNFMRAPV